MDHAGIYQEMVHAGAMADGRLRNRPAPGGIFRTVMRSPEGKEFQNAGCYLEVIENEKLVWTAALAPGYRPQNVRGIPVFTAVILLEPHGAGTKYTAIAIHGEEEAAKKHSDMGFHTGWGKALDQLVALAKTM
jgi:uncharacterized protein YndB with AHSA1/START domain